jgi:ribonuclease J
VKAGIELLDASRNGIVDARVLKERQQLAEDGVITMLAVISTDGVMAAPPRVNLRGVVTAADPRKLSLWAEREITWVLENRWQQLSRNSGGKAPEVDWMGVQREIEVGLQRRLRRELQVEPLITCLVQPAPGGTPAYKGRADAEPDSRPAPRGRREGQRDGQRDRDRDRDRVERGDRSPQPQLRRDLAPVAAAVPAAPVAAASAAVIEEPELAANRTRRRRSTAAG